MPTKLLYFKNTSLKYEYVNKGFADLISKSADYVIGKSDIDLLEKNLIPKILYEKCLDSDKKTLIEGHYYGIETMGERHFRVFKEKFDGGLLCIVRDITDEVNATTIAETDFLTGLYNRNKFMNSLLMAQQIIQIVAKIQILQQEIVQKLNTKNTLNQKKNKVEILYQVLE